MASPTLCSRRAIAGPDTGRDHDRVQLPSNSLHFFYGPLIALALVLLLGGMLRWTFGTQQQHRMPDRSGAGGYGLLREVALVPTIEAAEVLRRRLAADGIRASVTATPDGSGRRLMVFAEDEPTARLVLARKE